MKRRSFFATALAAVFAPLKFLQKDRLPGKRPACRHNWEVIYRGGGGDISSKCKKCGLGQERLGEASLRRLCNGGEIRFPRKG